MDGPKVGDVRLVHPGVTLANATEAGGVASYPFSTRPATASSFRSSSGSRASGAVIMAPSSARSDPTGQASCASGRSRATARRAGPPCRRSRCSTLMIAGDLDRVVLGVPAIVVGHHGDRRIGDLGLAGELRLGHRRHADDVVAEALVGERLGVGRELRPLHADIGATAADTGCPRPRAAAAIRSCSRGPTGCAMETWATQPLPKNELSRPCVRSTNWSTSTNSPG